MLVPSRPEEPDNCCMGGCVHCVWDAYRDEMDAWAAAEAEAKPRAQEAEEDTGRDGLAGAAWALGRRGEGENASLARDFWDEELYKNVPVGIREFMKQEKRLKEKHREEGTAAG